MQNIESRTLEYLGLVAGMVDELVIVNVLDKLVPKDLSQRKVSIGMAVKAMILNELGFANRQLYLLPQFFENKPIELLLKEGIKPEHLHDKTLGRALDAPPFPWKKLI